MSFISPNNVGERSLVSSILFFASPLFELPRALISRALSLSWVFSFQQVMYLFRDILFEFSAGGRRIHSLLSWK